MILDIGYDSSDVGFDGASCAILNAIGKQSPDITMGVDEGTDKEQGAGDQDLMFGYASDETDVLMPAPITYSHRLVEKQAESENQVSLSSFVLMRRQISMRYDKPAIRSQSTPSSVDTAFAGCLTGRPAQSGYGRNHQASAAR